MAIVETGTWAVWCCVNLWWWLSQPHGKCSMSLQTTVVRFSTCKHQEMNKCSVQKTEPPAVWAPNPGVDGRSSHTMLCCWGFTFWTVQSELW